MDLFAEALCQFYETSRAQLQIERDDGYEDTEDMSWYLTTFPAFPKFEKRALKFAHGRVLDAGCGAGRHSLYLQRRGLSVTAIDAAPQLVELARERGVKDARVANACGALPFAGGKFDTVVLFGNNLGLCGSVTTFRRMLRELAWVTSARGRILATTRMPNTTDAASRAYLARNVALGRAVGNMRLRLRLNGRQGAWFNLLLFSPTDLMELAAKEGWMMAQFFSEDDPQVGYAVVLEKQAG